MTKTIKPTPKVEMVKIYRDGNMWCVCYGTFSPETPVGFGKTLAKALKAFD